MSSVPLSNGRFSQINLGVVCPMASEEETAIRFVDEVLEQCLAKGFASIIFFAILDRACKDRTFELLQVHSKQQPLLRVVWAPENKSVVDAYVRGYREALGSGCDWILEIDAGFSHQPKDIPQFFDKMSEGYDCVFGNRFGAQANSWKGSFKRLIISRGGTLLSAPLVGMKLTDMTSGFVLFSRAGLETVLERGIKSRGPFFQTEIKAYCRNLNITEVPIHYCAPSHHIGSTALKDSFINLWRLYRLRLQGQL
jgi:dolichol-phosphate mannosyltransferase